jgi:hypothetical protein
VLVLEGVDPPDPHAASDSTIARMTSNGMIRFILFSSYTIFL